MARIAQTQAPLDSSPAEDVDAWFTLGLVYVNPNQPIKAIKACQQAIRINPEDASVWCNLGIANKISDHNSKDMVVCKRLKPLDPAQTDKLFNMVFPPQQSGLWFYEPT
ncbi:MAG: tetratricopeptide repeat protein [Anaerolineaceae bacterium]|nr:tetratricopeptide repeat protein [Anaerolineaceae bacterium]